MDDYTNESRAIGSDLQDKLLKIFLHMHLLQANVVLHTINKNNYYNLHIQAFLVTKKLPFSSNCSASKCKVTNSVQSL